MSTYVDTDDLLCWASAVTLANRSGLAVNTVRRIRTELCRAGFLELLNRGGQVGEKRTANVYRLTIPPLTQDDPSSSGTRHPERDDPSSSTRSPVIVRDPISKGSLNESLRESALDVEHEEKPDEIHAHFAGVMGSQYTADEVNRWVTLARNRGYSAEEIALKARQCSWPRELDKVCPIRASVPSETSNPEGARMNAIRAQADEWRKTFACDECRDDRVIPAVVKGDPNEPCPKCNGDGLAHERARAAAAEA
jgi:hypothetical protein